MIIVLLAIPDLLGQSFPLQELQSNFTGSWPLVDDSIAGTSPEGQSPWTSTGAKQVLVSGYVLCAALNDFFVGHEVDLILIHITSKCDVTSTENAICKPQQQKSSSRRWRWTRRHKLTSSLLFPLSSCYAYYRSPQSQNWCAIKTATEWLGQRVAGSIKDLLCSKDTTSERMFL